MTNLHGLRLPAVAKQPGPPCENSLVTNQGNQLACRRGGTVRRLAKGDRAETKCATGFASACVYGLVYADGMSESHRKTIRRYEDRRHLHELTFSCHRRLPLLTNDGWRKLLCHSLNAACDAEGFSLIAFVFMPEHVHLLVLPKTDESKVSRLLARTKQPASKQIRQILEANHSPLLQKLTVQERPGKQCFRFWQEGAGFDRNLFSPDAIGASIDYIHSHPVKRNLCHAAVDFKWSSARFHLCGVIDPDLPTLHKPDPEWFHKSGIRFD